ncbi:hypothetical protein PG984_005721 [Apiospora sp. TS-2023a]
MTMEVAKLIFYPALLSFAIGASGTPTGLIKLQGAAPKVAGHDGMDPNAVGFAHLVVDVLFGVLSVAIAVIIPIWQDRRMRSRELPSARVSTTTFPEQRATPVRQLESLHTMSLPSQSTMSESPQGQHVMGFQPETHSSDNIRSELGLPGPAHTDTRPLHSQSARVQPHSQLEGQVTAVSHGPLGYRPKSPADFL